ncbi:MAG: hypothetical protein HQM00_02500 [Magnetococcales bacterium]|nr:hypothetical protein [Magnetococcales bacterium]
MLLRLSEHPLSQRWISQFRSTQDRSLAAQLVNQLKLVSASEFETGIECSIVALQKQLNTTVAVYPVVPPDSADVVGYNLFSGAVTTSGSSSTKASGKRRKYGSEDRVGHFLENLSRTFQRPNGMSVIEVSPTLNQLKAQRIRHIIFVDDICGSGTRLLNFWKSVVPKRIKSLLSLRRLELWIVLFAATPKGHDALKEKLTMFPIDNHLISVHPASDFRDFLSQDMHDLCVNYARLQGMESVGMGYKGSACPFVFEHGCPNNLPSILWKNTRKWKGLFPNRGIPEEIRRVFGTDSPDRTLDVLWESNQPRLALSLLETLDKSEPLTNDNYLMIVVLGLRLRGFSEQNLAGRLLMEYRQCEDLIQRAVTMGLYERAESSVTPLGREVVKRFRDRQGKPLRNKAVGKNPEEYYPVQCEGRLR